MKGSFYSRFFSLYTSIFRTILDKMVPVTIQINEKINERQYKRLFLMSICFVKVYVYQNTIRYEDIKILYNIIKVKEKDG